MLSHQLKLIFVHIPKNAGQSVERCFIQYLDTSWKDKDSFLLTNNTDPRKGPARLAHLTASEYVSCGHVAPSQFENYFKFSFVRNPWAKLVSEYKWRRYYTQWSFKDWINQGFPTQDDGIHWRHVMPQYDYLYDTNGNCLVDFIGHFEQLKDDFDAIKKKLDEPLLSLPHTNQSLKKSKRIRSLFSVQSIKLLRSQLQSKEPFHDSYVDYYDVQTWQWVAQKYQKDIETFGYEQYLNKLVS